MCILFDGTWYRLTAAIVVLYLFTTVINSTPSIPGSSLHHGISDSQQEKQNLRPVDFNRPPPIPDTGSARHEHEQELKIDNKKLVSYDSHGNPIGYVKVPKFIQGDTRSRMTQDDGLLHIIFSSGCNYFQHWQSEFLLTSALLAGQHGRITRIVSGCYDRTAEKAHHKHQTFPGGINDLLVPLEVLNRSVNENFGLFITPAFKGAIDFPWINKPSSIEYFMQHARSELDRVGETIIAVIDPDFVFLKPLTQTGETRDNIIATRGHENTDTSLGPIDVARRGRPVSQRYGLEGHWVKKFAPLEQITGNKNSPSKQWTYKMASKWTSVGPPMILEINDITELSILWEKNMRPVLDIGGPDILADMWAYSIAAADLDLKHTTLDHFMISVWGHTGQAYKFIDEFKQMSCRDPEVKINGESDGAEGVHWPVFIHLASNFKAHDEGGVEWMFHKGHVPATILECDTPLIVEAPDNLFDLNRHDSDIKVYQRAWVICNTVSRLNKMLIMYKEKFCPNGYESRKLVRLIQKKTLDRGCNQKKDKWCFPLAQIEGLPANWRKLDSA